MKDRIIDEYRRIAWISENGAWIVYVQNGLRLMRKINDNKKGFFMVVILSYIRGRRMKE